MKCQILFFLFFFFVMMNFSSTEIAMRLVMVNTFTLVFVKTKCSQGHMIFFYPCHAE